MKFSWENVDKKYQIFFGGWSFGFCMGLWFLYPRNPYCLFLVLLTSLNLIRLRNPKPKN
jgi:hypothetical protein